MVQKIKYSDYILKPSEIKKLIYATKSFRDRCILKILAYTAIRRHELVGLDIQDIDFERKRMTVRKGKGGKIRIIPLSEDLLSDLKHLIGNNNKGPLFESSKSQRISIRQINRIVSRAGNRAGMENPNPALKSINPHLLRHSFSGNAKKEGMRIDVLSLILGHASTKTTMDMYGTPNMEDIQEEYEKKIGMILG